MSIKFLNQPKKWFLTIFFMLKLGIKRNKSTLTYSTSDTFKMSSGYCLRQLSSINTSKLLMVEFWFPLGAFNRKRFTFLILFFSSLIIYKQVLSVILSERTPKILPHPKQLTELCTMFIDREERSICFHHWCDVKQILRASIFLFILYYSCTLFVGTWYLLPSGSRADSHPMNVMLIFFWTYFCMLDDYAMWDRAKEWEEILGSKLLIETFPYSLP